MKKIFYILSSLILFFLIFTVTAYYSLPKTLSFFFGRAMNGNASIEKVEIGYKDKLFTFHIKGIALEGIFTGNINSVYLSFDLKKEFCFNDIVISDFNIFVETEKEGKRRFIFVPSEHVSLKNGIVKYNNNSIKIHEININHLKYKKPFIFSLHVENDLFFNSVKAKGTGKYSRKEIGLKGDMEVIGLKSERISDNLKGFINIKCNFNYEKGVLTLKGPFDIFDFALKTGFLSKPLMIKNVKGTASLKYSKKTFDINISRVEFKSTPFNITMKIDSKGLSNLILNSGYLDINDIKEYISFDRISKEVEKYTPFVKSGKLMLMKLVYGENTDFLCEAMLKNTSLMYDDIEIRNITAGLIFSGKRVIFKNMQGQYKNSMVKNVTGEIIYGEKNSIRLKGDYSLNLVDIPSRIDIGNIRFKNGLSEGVFELDYTDSKDYKLSGKGTLNESEVSYDNVAFIAHGYYRFNKDEIEFDPIILKKSGTNIKIRGKWRKDFLRIKLLGVLDVFHIKPFIKIPFDIKGVVDIDGNVVKEQDIWKFSGYLNMDYLGYRIEDYLKKDEGVKSSVAIDAYKKDDEIEIKHLDFKIEDLNLSASGRLLKNVARGVSLKLLVPEVKNKGNIFFFNGERPEGRVLIDLYIKEVSFPLKKIPHITGILEINKGYFKIPDMHSPISEIDLTAYFRGDELEIKGNNIKCGDSHISSLVFISKGIEATQFSLNVDIEYFDYKDFKTPGELMIYPIRPDNVFADAKGDITLRGKRVNFENKTGENVFLMAVYDDRKFNVSELKANALDGDVEAHGTFDLSGDVPYLKFTGTMKGISSGEFLKMFGAKSHIIESKEFIFFDLNTKGNSIKDFARTLSGRATIYSEDGVIKRMNLLTKIFGLLNVYELLKGEVDLTTTGFRYKTTGANFSINNGVFTTKDYIIDSPVMVITGQGSLNLVDQTIEGKIMVSPLVTIDRIVSKIPVLRNILKDKKRGFIYAIYDVKGPVEDPDINLRYMQTIGSLPLNILRGLLEYPKTLFNKINR